MSLIVKKEDTIENIERSGVAEKYHKMDRYQWIRL